MSDPKLNCVDMSQWGGPLTAGKSHALWDAGVRNIKVGTGYAGVGGAGVLSKQQGSQWLDINAGRGGSLDAYLYLYFAGNAAQQVRQGIATLAGVAVRRWWLDAEDVASPELSPAQRVEFLRQCCAELDAQGLSYGIYTAHWWWPENMANSTVFAYLPLWNSWYDDDPDTDGLPYGGWTDSAVEQYAGTTMVGGQSVDLDYDKTLEDSWEDDLSQAQYDELKAQIKRLERATFAGGETPANEDRDVNADYRIGEIDVPDGKQSVNDVAQSAIAIALQESGKITPDMDRAAIRAVIDEELAKARITLSANQISNRRTTMANIIDVLRDYDFIPSGEAVRAVEVTVATAVVWSLSQQDLTTLGNWRAWLGSAACAGLIAGIAAIKGLLPKSQ